MLKKQVKFGSDDYKKSSKAFYVENNTVFLWNSYRDKFEKVPDDIDEALIKEIKESLEAVRKKQC